MAQAAGLAPTFWSPFAQTQNSTADEVVQVFWTNSTGWATRRSTPTWSTVVAFPGGGQARSLETSSGFNSIVANLLLDGLEPAEAARYADRLAAVSPEAAAKAAADFVGSEKATVIIVGNSAEFLDDLKAIRPDVEVISADELDLSSKDLVRSGG